MALVEVEKSKRGRGGKHITIVIFASLLPLILLGMLMVSWDESKIVEAGGKSVFSGLDLARFDVYQRSNLFLLIPFLISVVSPLILQTRARVLGSLSIVLAGLSSVIVPIDFHLMGVSRGYEMRMGVGWLATIVIGFFAMCLGSYSFAVEVKKRFESQREFLHSVLGTLLGLLFISSFLLPWFSLGRYGGKDLVFGFDLNYAFLVFLVGCVCLGMQEPSIRGIYLERGIIFSISGFHTIIVLSVSFLYFLAKASYEGAEAGSLLGWVVGLVAALYGLALLLKDYRCKGRGEF